MTNKRNNAFLTAYVRLGHNGLVEVRYVDPDNKNPSEVESWAKSGERFVKITGRAVRAHGWWFFAASRKYTTINRVRHEFGFFRGVQSSA